MRDKNSVELSVLRMLKSNIDSQTKAGEELTDELTLKMVSTEVKKRKEAIKIYQDSNKNDRADQENAELKILSKYQPKQLDEVEIKKVVQAKIVELGAKDISQIGQVMGQVKGELQNKADMGVVSKIVKEELSA